MFPCLAILRHGEGCTWFGILICRWRGSGWNWWKTFFSVHFNQIVEIDRSKPFLSTGLSSFGLLDMPKRRAWEWKRWNQTCKGLNQTLWLSAGKLQKLACPLSYRSNLACHKGLKACHAPFFWGGGVHRFRLQKTTVDVLAASPRPLWLKYLPHVWKLVWYASSL